MNSDPTDFMLQEYSHIATAFFGLSNQVNDWLKTYLTLVGLPLTLIAAALRFGGEPGVFAVSLNNLPDVVAGLLILVSVLGLFVVLSVVNMRMEMILYARTINAVRRYFGERDRLRGGDKPSLKLVDFLILPTSDSKPPFFEPSRALFWQVAAVGIVDGLILGTAMHSLFSWSWYVTMFAGAAFALLHIFVYRTIARQRDGDWKVHFPDDLSRANI